ncbi:hypothetical protein EUTSA_v10005377mg [Eutrema salsugineum]|uniref:Response regulatory domain-containing protein n=1 Tax=Eutrema salsugineum TaxID=72664 RepID=V4K498_EUTSA|nr:hypothetical protein EUTSA_v10005377mg [Eutrema salsugineum]
MTEKWEPEIHDGVDPSRYHPNSSDMFPGMYKFPEGLRVLLFDEDPTLTLEQHLQEFQYEVTKCNEEERAMYLLRNHRNRFDIAIIEAQNAHGDRFRFISEIGSEMDLPIIIISNDDSVESVINWMNNGACDYLIKPIRYEDLRLIFKYQTRGEEDTSMDECGSGRRGRGESRNREFIFCERSHRQENKEGHDHDRDPTTKKRRVVWDEELHSKFIEAVRYLGKDHAVPKRILERMNVDGITRENVASHLQVTFSYYITRAVNKHDSYTTFLDQNSKSILITNHKIIYDRRL